MSNMDIFINKYVSQHKCIKKLEAENKELQSTVAELSLLPDAPDYFEAKKSYEEAAKK